MHAKAVWLRMKGSYWPMYRSLSKSMFAPDATATYLMEPTPRTTTHHASTSRENDKNGGGTSRQTNSVFLPVGSAAESKGGGAICHVLSVSPLSSMYFFIPASASAPAGSSTPPAESIDRID